MSFRLRPIPKWANVAGWVWIVLVIGFTLYNASANHLDFVQGVGYFWTHIGVIVAVVVAGDMLLYGIAVLIDLARGRTPPTPEKEEDYSSDVANITP